MDIETGEVTAKHVLTKACLPSAPRHQHCNFAAGLLVPPDTEQTPAAQLRSLQLGTHKTASVAMRPEFFVILAESTSPGAQHPAVLPPPDPVPKGTKPRGIIVGSLLAASANISLQTTLPLICRHNRLGILLAWPDLSTGMVDWIFQAFVPAPTFSTAAELHRMDRERCW